MIATEEATLIRCFPISSPQYKIKPTRMGLKMYLITNSATISVIHFRARMQSKFLPFCTLNWLTLLAMMHTLPP